MKRKLTTVGSVMSDETRAYFRRVFNLQIEDFEIRYAVANQILDSACRAQRHLERARKAEGQDKLLTARYYDECDVYLRLLSQLKLLGIMSEDDRRMSAKMLEDWVTAR